MAGTRRVRLHQHSLGARKSAEDPSHDDDRRVAHAPAVALTQLAARRLDRRAADRSGFDSFLPVDAFKGRPSVIERGRQFFS